MTYRIVSWSGENARSDVILRERTSSLAVALKLARWSFEDSHAQTVTVYEDERPFNFHSVEEIHAVAVDRGIA